MATDLTVTDLFCGLGGSSEGARMAGATVSQALNHHQPAVAVHAANHPDADHHVVDVSQTDPRAFRPTSLVLASPSCRHHSASRTSAAVDSGQMSLLNDDAAARSRATGYDILRWLDAHPSIQGGVIENVPAWLAWAGVRTVFHGLDGYGYHFQPILLNAQDFGVAQSRDRVFVVYWRKSMTAPDLGIRRTAHCPSCDRQVDSRQLFVDDYQSRLDDLHVEHRARAAVGKEPRRALVRWGLYGKQWQWACPSCSTTVQPAVAAVGDVVDTTLPAPLLDPSVSEGRRASIRRGIAGLARTAPRRPMPSRPGTAATRPGRDAGVLFKPIGGSTYERPGSTCRTRTLADVSWTLTTISRHALLYVPDPDRQPADPAQVDLAGVRERQITSREEASLMGFRDDYILPDDPALSRKAVGNAVAPPVMADLVSRLAAAIDGRTV